MSRKKISQGKTVKITKMVPSKIICRRLGITHVTTFVSGGKKSVQNPSNVGALAKLSRYGDKPLTIVAKTATATKCRDQKNVARDTQLTILQRATSLRQCAERQQTARSQPLQLHNALILLSAKC